MALFGDYSPSFGGRGTPIAPKRHAFEYMNMPLSRCIVCPPLGILVPPSIFGRGRGWVFREWVFSRGSLGRGSLGVLF